MIYPLEDCSLEGVLDLWNQGFRDYDLPMTTSRQGFLDRLRDLNISSQASLVYLEEGAYLGLALVAETSFKSRREFWLAGLAVRPEARGRFIGRSLILALEDLAKERGVARIVLEQLATNEGAGRFYGGLGFSKVNELKLARIRPEGEAGQFDFRPADPARLREGESPQTAYQNRLARSGCLELVLSQGRELGYVFYTYGKFLGLGQIHLMQLEIYRPEDLDLVGALVQALSKRYDGAYISLFNFNCQARTYGELGKLAHQEGLIQYQLEKVLGD